ncbi:hypothetical protein EON83_01770 [bacterium]|nr:MAG: hypothetical protein EON83_01770 [bacterium]
MSRSLWSNTPLSSWAKIKHPLRTSAVCGLLVIFIAMNPSLSNRCLSSSLKIMMVGALVMPMASPAFAATTQVTKDALINGWLAPPESTKPFCYWYWLNNIVTKQGITRDVEMMAKNGVGGAYIANIGGWDLDPPRNGRVKGYSDEGYELLQHAVREGKRLGVQIGVFNGSGWSQSGGPWVKPEDGMQYIDSTEVRVAGGKRYEAVLPRCKGALADVCTIAFPAPPDDGKVLKPLRVTSAQGGELAVLADGLPHDLSANKDYGRLSLTWEFETAQTVRSVLFTHHDGGQVRGNISYSQDGTAFKPLRDFTLDRRAGDQVNLPNRPSSASTPPTTARFFRVEMPWHTGRDGQTLGVAFSSAARLEMAEEKQLGIASRQMEPLWNTFMWPATPEPGSGTVAPDKVLDLTSKVSADGRLSWDAPSGNWIVQRFSTVLIDARPSPAPEGMGGLEVDKMSREAAKRHIDNGVVGELYRRLKPEERSAFTYAIADSYERGFQNWTPRMVPEFVARYGYDPIPWLPVFSGRIVGSAAQSDRFLWDVRRLVADLIATNYVGGMRDAARPYGLKLWLENYGHWGFPSEFAYYGGNTDEVAGEYWSGLGVWSAMGEMEIRDAASAGHTYGKNLVWAEAFTAAGEQSESPSTIKARGDWAFSQGVNRYVLHVNSHQPTDVPGPGLDLVWGTYFNRKTLWYAEHGKSWVDYVRRSCYLLQHGAPAADIAYYIGDDTPQMTGQLDPQLPAGYDYDWLNSDALLTRAKVRKGRLVLPGGASYAILVLPAKATMRPAMLERIAAFVRQGLTVVGAAPTHSPSLRDYPRADAKIQALASSLWPRGNAEKRKIGLGTVWNSTPLAPVLAGLKVGPPIIEPNTSVLWKQRTSLGTEVFFLSNQTEETLLLAPSFRVSGRIPELWDAETATIKPLGAYRETAGRTVVPLTLTSHQSIFVVFRKPTRTLPTVTELTRDGKPLLNWNDNGIINPNEVADSNLNQSFWIKPSDTIGLPEQHLGGVTLPNQRWALMPLQGTFARGAGFAGTGISVGSNGVAVIQHWSDNAPAVLVWRAPTPLTDWTHILVSYRAGVPHLFVNGVEAATGIRSGQRIVEGRAGLAGEIAAESPFARNVRAVKTSYGILSAADIAALAHDQAEAPDVKPLNAQVLRSADGKLQLQTDLAGRYSITLKDGRILTSQVPASLPDIRLNSLWEVSFSGAAAPVAQRWNELNSWSDSTDETTKYFSGNATYTTNFDLPTNYKTDNSLCTLDLGQVRIIARVTVNGQEAGTAMLAPYSLEIGRFLKPGRNTLKVLVTNTWANRMIGDEQYPDDLAGTRDGNGTLTQWPEWAFSGVPRPEPRRITLSSRRFFTKNSLLPPSGLIGPVNLKFSILTTITGGSAKK